MARTGWVTPIRLCQVLLGIAIFALIIYTLAVYKFDNATKFMLFLGIWTGFIAPSYLGLAPVHFPRLAHYLVIPVVEISTFIMLLVGLILKGVDLPPASDCKFAACEATQAVVVITAVECVLFLATSIQSIIDARRLHDKTVAKEQIVQTAAAREGAPETTQATETV
ncbi:MARVEL domain-containing protein [Aspergillus candidus]|uniref:MARVEL domain-containing protein n=1 Tax=Aspergillus candidus TaxID=41067 RepID=A0A2I2F611_ASPCN|nr:hypothetical protein BDW47DRAFT_54825 [Aspergillus candidus]PLB36067.1 hypothetical protein BDW47DRAFT_54825 [Aspergillus candidus]